MRFTQTYRMGVLENQERIEHAHRNGHTPTTNNAGALPILRANRLLRTLPEEEVAQLAASGRWVTFDRGEPIARQTAPAEAVLFIVEGRAEAEVFSPINTAFKAVVNFPGPGDDIGLLALVDGAPHSATVTAREEIRALAVPLDTMKDLLRRHAECYRVLAEVAVERARASGTWMKSLI